MVSMFPFFRLKSFSKNSKKDSVNLGMVDENINQGKNISQVAKKPANVLRWVKKKLQLLFEVSAS